MALSDDKLWDLWNAQGTDNMSKEEAFVFARAIEQAHGITQKGGA